MRAPVAGTIKRLPRGSVRTVHKHSGHTDILTFHMRPANSVIGMLMFH